MWVDTPCKTLTWQSLSEHEGSVCYQAASCTESTRALAEKDGTISQAFNDAISVQRKAFIGHLKCMYFLNKQEITHTTNFLPLVDLGRCLGATYL